MGSRILRRRSTTRISLVGGYSKRVREMRENEREIMKILGCMLGGGFCGYV